MKRRSVSERVVGAVGRIEHFIGSGHTVRALVELRALLDETRFWDDPNADSVVRDAYFRSVDRFTARGVSEAELNITLRA